VDEKPATVPLDGEPLYDHTVAAPKRRGLILLVGLLFMGGAQLVKRDWKRFLGLWALFIGLIAIGIVLRPVGVLLQILTVGCALVWAYALWDAVTRP
jgi:hypothetical protein